MKREKKRRCSLYCALSLSLLFAYEAIPSTFFMTFSHPKGTETHFFNAGLICEEKDQVCFEKTDLSPFDRLVISWEGERPAKGGWRIEVSLLQNSWSPWFEYAYWGESAQYTFEKIIDACAIAVEQDVIKLMGKKAQGCRVRFIAEEGALLSGLRGIALSFVSHEHHRVTFENREVPSILLDLEGLSQVALADARAMRLCSPTSTCAVLRYLTPLSELSPLLLADRVVDQAFDIYGNWVLNTAQASHLLGEKWNVYVAYLSSFEAIIDQLKKGCPVIVSVKGKLEGALVNYFSGHLLVVIGYDPLSSRVYCMDPAYETDEKTKVSYEIEEFLSAWRSRGGIAYLFSPKDANP